MRISDWSSDVCSSDLYGDGDALRRFAAQVDVVTYEFENIETGPVVELADVVTVRPSIGALQVAQDRLSEKDFVSGLGGRPAPYRAVSSRAGLDEALGENGAPANPQKRQRGRAAGRERGGQDGELWGGAGE